MTILAIGPKSPAPLRFCDQPGGAVLALQPDRQRVDAGPQRGHLTFGAALGGLQFGDPLVGQPQRGHRAVVVFVEADLALVEFTDAALHGLELGPAPAAARAAASSMPSDSRATPLVDRLDPGPHGLHLAGQPGQALTAVGLGAHRRQVGAFGLGGDALGLTQFGPGRLQPGPRLGQFGEQLALLLGDLVGLGVQRVGVGAAASNSRARPPAAGRARWRSAPSR